VAAASSGFNGVSAAPHPGEKDLRLASFAV